MIQRKTPERWQEIRKSVNAFVNPAPNQDRNEIRRLLASFSVVEGIQAIRKEQKENEQVSL
jgi:hypothetical protein